MTITGVDTGGTFTDFIYKLGGRWGVIKLPSSSDDPARAVIKGLQCMSSSEEMQVVHGSTVATNAVLERTGARTAIITNAGFEDFLRIGRQNRRGLYDLFYSHPAPLVPSSRCFGVPGRMDSQGREIEPLDFDAAREVAGKLREAGIQSAAVCFLFSYLNSQHEAAMQCILEAEGIEVSASHRILAEFREVERMSTTALNSYVSPHMSAYLENLRQHLPGASLRIMQSNGGSISAKTAMQEPVRTIVSGPAGGVVGAFEVGRAAGFKHLITLDMGGTSTDVSLINGDLPLSLEAEISGYPLRLPMLDIHTVGAGGGSIAALDAGDALKVGPESAGADPGPVCYGRGEQITVTDANLFLGRLVAERFLGGEMDLDRGRLQGAFDNLAGKTGLTPARLGEGILEVANANMERAIRVISVERGFDPREFTLVSFGGAGGLHCAFLARLLSVPRVLIPENPGILSAMGMCMADVIRDYSQTVMLPGSDTSSSELGECFKRLEDCAKQEMLGEGFSVEKIYMERYLDMRYKGQSFELLVPFDADYQESFGLLHEKKYGYRNPDSPTEVVNLRLRTSGIPEKPELQSTHRFTEEIPKEAWLEKKEVIFEGQCFSTPVVARDRLLAGNYLPGPAIIVEYTSTTVVPPFARADVDALGNLVMHVQS